MSLSAAYLDIVEDSKEEEGRDRKLWRRHGAVFGQGVTNTLRRPIPDLSPVELSQLQNKNWLLKNPPYVPPTTQRMGRTVVAPPELFPLLCCVRRMGHGSLGDVRVRHAIHNFLFTPPPPREAWLRAARKELSSMVNEEKVVGRPMSRADTRRLRFQSVGQVCCCIVKAGDSADKPYCYMSYRGHGEGTDRSPSISVCFRCAEYNSGEDCFEDAECLCCHGKIRLCSNGKGTCLAFSCLASSLVLEPPSATWLRLITRCQCVEHGDKVVGCVPLCYDKDGFLHLDRFSPSCFSCFL